VLCSIDARGEPRSRLGNAGWVPVPAIGDCAPGKWGGFFGGAAVVWVFGFLPCAGGLTRGDAGGWGGGASSVLVSAGLD
jgi:hypothetical protein